MSIPPEELRSRVANHLLQHGDDLSFTKYFWKGCEPLPRDKMYYSKLAALVSADARGQRLRNPSESMGVGLGSATSWAKQAIMPKLGHYLGAFVELGDPGLNKVWLAMECSHGQANPIGKFLRVPTRIESWKDIEEVLAQTLPVAQPSPHFSRTYLFGFLIGIVIGDAHKPKPGNGHRNIHIVLSKKYDTNVAIGDFATFCANDLGLRMRRHPDGPKPHDKPFGFYVWVSQSSPFIDWIFNVVLGLKDGQHTTYDQVSMDWALEAPLDFRLGLIQGIAESDGSVSVASQTVEFWVIPDWDFMIKLLATFGLRGFRNREAVSLVKLQAVKSFSVPVFAPHLRTVRYGLLELLATTPRLEKKERVPPDVRTEIMRLANEGTSIPKIVAEIARKRKLLVSFEAAQRWATKTGKYLPRHSSESREMSEQ
jgi:hypothetical protein